jgi:hypothetical protein
MGCFVAIRVDKPRGGHLARPTARWIRWRPSPQHVTSAFKLHDRHPFAHSGWTSSHAPGDLHVMSQASPSTVIAPQPHMLEIILPPSNLRALPLHLWSSLVTRLCAHHPEIASPLPMPRLRGKPRRGATWYAARGKEMPHSDALLAVNPPIAPALLIAPDPPFAPAPAEPIREADLPVLAPIVAPAPAEPILEAPQDLSPLSNPYACRLEWFDTMGNSLGFAPPPPPPLSTSSTASSHLPTSSTASS